MARLDLGGITTTDYHTAGEPFRIVTGGVPDIPGATVLERREHAVQSEELESIRRLLVHEPRGHTDMYGCFLVPPDDDEADFGALFWHKDGYSTACGHGTIALGAWAVRTRRVAPVDDGDTDVVIDVPSGRVTARVTCASGEVVAVAFCNVPAYVVGRQVPVRTSRGEVLADLSYGGALYASVSAASAGLTVTPEHYADLRALGREVKWALEETPWSRHRIDSRLDGVYGTILYDDLGDLDGGGALSGRSTDRPPTHAVHQRNITVFADGEVDRSPCGSGTSARLALLADEGRLGAGNVLVHDSVIATRFTGRVVETVSTTAGEAFVTEIRGMAHRTGEHVFLVDPGDPLLSGFVLG
jgi:proline racemase